MEKSGCEKSGYDQQLSLRKDGKLPIIAIEATCLAEATHKAIIACHDQGARAETPKQKPGMILGSDANMLIRISHPDSNPKVYYPGFYDTGEGAMQYILEVTHGIHDHWKKDAQNPERWGYTYHERFIDQIPFVLERIKHDWNEKKGEWCHEHGRPTGRDYQFAIWRAGEDIILEQPDAPCWQLGQLRFLQDEQGDIVMNYATNWRSRDLLKAWNQNNLAQIQLMKNFKDKIEDMLQVPIKLGSYTDHSDSLHLYGLYYERDGLEQQIEQMKKDGWEKKSSSLDHFLMATTGKTKPQLKRYIAAQMHAEAKGHGLNQSENTLKELGYNLETFPYPKEWDSWDPKFDYKMNPNLLARVK